MGTRSSKIKKSPRSENDMLKSLAKDIVLHCFRNTHLENIHAGKSYGGAGAGFSNAEMKKLMIEAVDKTYTFLIGTIENRFSPMMTAGIAMYRGSHADWNEPKTVRGWLKK
jgi:hypothetical protein